MLNYEFLIMNEKTMIIQNLTFNIKNWTKD